MSLARGRFGSNENIGENEPGKGQGAHGDFSHGKVVNYFTMRNLALLTGLLFLSIAPLAAKVNGAGISGKDETAAWDRHLEIVVKEGKAGKLGPGIAADSGLPQGSFVRVMVSPAKNNDDERHRNFQVVFSSAESSRVTHVVLQAMEKNIKKHEGRIETFRLTPSGALEQATLFETKVDGAGKPVPGTDRVSQLPLEARKTKKALGRELDYWLKGVGRKVPDVLR